MNEWMNEWLDEEETLELSRKPLKSQNRCKNFGNDFYNRGINRQADLEQACKVA